MNSRYCLFGQSFYSYFTIVFFFFFFLCHFCFCFVLVNQMFRFLSGSVCHFLMIITPSISSARQILRCWKRFYAGMKLAWIIWEEIFCIAGDFHLVVYSLSERVTLTYKILNRLRLHFGRKIELTSKSLARTLS